MAEESHIHVSKYGTSYIGRDATTMYRVMTIRSGIELHKRTGMYMTRGVTISKLFLMAKEYTGKKYRRGQHDAAIQDLTVWIENMKSALPTEYVND